ncbi:hypothetical protein [Prosthecobacter sp.]|uniref:hypothetical protein n=1 Tax=Prosthecobacter sp. TaxID=1965333 RepID=UPI00378494E0
MAELEEVILAKLKDNDPMGTRDLQRCFHDLSAKGRERAVASLKKACRVVEMECGRRAAAACAAISADWLRVSTGDSRQSR